MKSKKGIDIPIWVIVMAIFLLIMFIGLGVYNTKLSGGTSIITRLLS